MDKNSRTLPVRDAPGNDSGDVDGRILLLAAHHVKPEPLLRLGQLNHPAEFTFSILVSVPVVFFYIEGIYGFDNDMKVYVLRRRKDSW